MPAFHSSSIVPMQAPSLVYIAGYGRSGSTLLDIIFSNLGSAWGGGELCWLFEKRVEKGSCSCGKPLQECPFWIKVFSLLREWGFEWSDEEAARITSRTQRVGGTFWPDDHRTYIAIWSQVLAAIREVSGADIIIDSSKTARRSTRRPRLLQQAGEKIAVIHLVRDPRSVMRSVKKGSNRRLERGEPAHLLGGGLRGIAGWTITNALFEASAYRYRDYVLRARYEDIVNKTKWEISRIAHFLGVDSFDIIERIEHGVSFNPGHAIAGNRMRRNIEIKIMSTQTMIQKHTTADKMMPYILPLMRRYGYV